jgi:hypothetical protein
MRCPFDHRGPAGSCQGPCRAWEGYPLGRIAESEDVANLVAFLASGELLFFTANRYPNAQSQALIAQEVA